MKKAVRVPIVAMRVILVALSGAPGARSVTPATLVALLGIPAGATAQAPEAWSRRIPGSAPRVVPQGRAGATARPARPRLAIRRFCSRPSQ